MRDAVVDAASVGTALWLIYLLVLFYFAIAAGAATHLDLLLENSVKVPFLNVELPLADPTSGLRGNDSRGCEPGFLHRLQAACTPIARPVAIARPFLIRFIHHLLGQLHALGNQRRVSRSLLI